MSSLQQQLESTAQWVADQLAPFERVDEGHTYPWPNHIWTAERFRRAHLDVVDARESHKLYMLHLTVFPHTNDPSPIFGFDVIAGPRKVTGLFHDFSPVGEGTALDQQFSDSVRGTQWSKQRELPVWARAIFSPNMVAAGNIQDPDELRELLALVQRNLSTYLSGVGQTTNTDYTVEQNRYCYNQKQNPHTPRVMEALGYEAEVVREFIDSCLFPEVALNTGRT